MNSNNLIFLLILREKINNIVELVSIYNIEHDKSYEIYYTAMLTYAYCDNPEEMYVGLVESNYIDIFNWLAKYIVVIDSVITQGLLA